MEGMRVLIGIILLIVGCVIGFVGYQYDDTVRTEVASKSVIVTKELFGSKTKYYYTTTDNIQHEVTAAKYIDIPQKGMWIHVAPTHTGKIIMGVGLVILVIGAFVIAPDLTFILIILEGCS